ncbi:MAG: hypothetical protein H0W55_03130 [Actinobacteria bacterium]|nr:hypothetical protein [Actinomycetota bacterium]
MRRSALCLATVAFLLAPTAAMADPPPGATDNVPDVAIEACVNVVVSQSDRGVAAGGGPKEGIVAPTNCDFFFFIIGAIGEDSH